MGPAKSLKVYPGDQVDIEVWEYHEGASGFGTTSTPLTTLITMVSGAFGGYSGGIGEPGLIYNGVNSALNGFVPPGNQGSNRPAAYLNYILFDANYNVLDAGAQVAPATTFTKQKLSFNTLSIKEPGYVFVYLSYDNDSNNWVYFDDFKITHNKSNVIQYNEYYPFGMQTAKSWTREGNKNDYLYNAGNEMNSNTGWYETFFRGYDATLGKFLQTDPMADKYGNWTPYSYAFNDPVFWNDPMGDDASDASHGFNWHDVSVRYPEYLDASSGMYGASWNEETYGSSSGAGGGYFAREGVGAWRGPNFEQMAFIRIVRALSAELREAGINLSFSKWGLSITTTELLPMTDEDIEFMKKTGANIAGYAIPTARFIKVLNNPDFYNSKVIGAQTQDWASAAGQRVDAALMVIGNYRANGTSYSQPNRQFGCDVKYADCSSTVTTILKQAGQETIFKGTYTAAMRDEIAAKSTNNTYRFQDPLAGDIMMWGGHVALVTAVLDGRVYFATMGRSGAAIGSVRLDSSCSLLTESTWGGGGFLGFWTPD